MRGVTMGLRAVEINYEGVTMGKGDVEINYEGCNDGIKRCGNKL